MEGQMIMQTYSFSFANRSIKVDSASKLDAYDVANRKFGSLPQGVWMEGSSKNSFHWALGNFFD
jgi:hypothetical protein